MVARFCFVRAGDQWSPIRDSGKCVRTVGRGIAPAVKKVDAERRGHIVSGIQNPLCAGMECGCGAAVERKACPKPKGFGGVRIGSNKRHQRKRTAFAVLFLWCTFRDSNPGPTD